MKWILIGTVVLFCIYMLIVFARAGAKDIDEEATEEAHYASQKELARALHPPPKTKEEIEEENEMYEDK